MAEVGIAYASVDPEKRVWVLPGEEVTVICPGPVGGRSEAEPGSFLDESTVDRGGAAGGPLSARGAK